MPNHPRKAALFLVLVFALALAPFLLLTPEQASATHAWGPYHWARTANPFTLKLGDNVDANWDSYLFTTSGDWSVSSVLDTTIAAGQGGKNCFATYGAVQVCNKTYGRNGWLGLAQIWVSGSHIVAATAKMNDSYFNLSFYNTPVLKQFVMCQEVGHTLGLDHQVDALTDTSCMESTAAKSTNQHPNQHDYDQLELIYGSHLDATATVASSVAGAAFGAGDDAGDGPDFGKPVRGHQDLFVRDLGNGRKLFTWVTWADRGAAGGK